MKKKFFENLKDKFYYSLLLFPIFLVSGPFLPDFTIAIFTIIFIFYLDKIFLKKIHKVINLKILTFFFSFFILLNINSAIINFNYFSLKSTIPHFRFYIFFIFLGYFFIKDEIFLKKYLLVNLIICILLIFDGLTQYIFGYNTVGLKMHDPVRITSFFLEEKIYGSFLIRHLPFVLLYFVLFKPKKFQNSLFVITSIFGVMIFLSGERTAFFMFLLFIFIIFFTLENKRAFFFKFTITFVVFVGLSLILNFNAFDRMLKKSISQIYIKDEKKINFFSPIHEAHAISAIRMFKNRPYFGHGVKSFRTLCNDKKFVFNENSCSTHPHNFYIQFLAELGIVGFLFLVVFYLYILFKTFKKIFFDDRSQKNLGLILCYSHILISLFPLMPTGNFFNNYLSILIFMPLSFIFYLENYKKKLF